MPLMAIAQNNDFVLVEDDEPMKHYERHLYHDDQVILNWYSGEEETIHFARIEWQKTKPITARVYSAPPPWLGGGRRFECEIRVEETA